MVVTISNPKARIEYIYFHKAALLTSFVIVCNISAPRTRRESVIDQLTSLGSGLAIFVFIHALTWCFAAPTYLRYPDSEVPDFWPIYALLLSWMGLSVLVFLGVGSKNFRGVIMGVVKNRNQVRLHCMNAGANALII